MFSNCVRAASLSKRRHLGAFSGYPNALPFIQLPRNSPMIGNGHLGTILDASSPPRNRSAAGPGAGNTLDLWHTSTSFWSCTDNCGKFDPYHAVPSCCSAVALGGVSLRLGALSPSGAPLNFSAAQDLDNGVLCTEFGSAGGGVVRTSTLQHPTQDLVETNVSYTPGAGDPPTLSLYVSTWVIGHNHLAPAQWTSGTPAPWRAGCADAHGAEAPCPGAALSFVSRNASTDSAMSMPVTAALATGVRLGAGAALRALAVTSAPAGPPGEAWEVTHTVVLPGGAWVVITMAEAEARGKGLGDPVPAALHLASAALVEEGGATAAAAAAFWAAYSARAAVSFPNAPVLEDIWVGANYILATASSASAAWPAPGLYGPWTTADSGRWHGDYTLDFNMQAFFYGAFSSNHGAQAASFWQPVLDTAAGPARVRARAEAGKAHANCSAAALFFPCHMAPWGQGSLDAMLNFMTWNGPFTSLIFINAFEYTRDADFAANVTLPLLEGLNAWWLCYLVKTATGPGVGQYVYADTNPYRSDMQAENQPVPNPQLGLAFLHRTVTAQMDITAALGRAPSAELQELAAHLPPLNTLTYQYAAPSDVRWGNESTGQQCLATDGGNATFFAIADVPTCRSLCATLPACAAYAHSTQGSNGTCFALFHSDDLVCTAAAGWAFGARAGVQPGAPPVNGTVWGGWQGAPLEKIDWGASGGLWPAEAVEPPDTPGADPLLAPVAQLTNLLTINFPGAAQGAPRACDIFTLAVRAGSVSAAANTGGTASPNYFSPEAVLAGMLDWARVALGPGNSFSWAEGGLENTGVTRAINEMLVRGVRRAGGGVGAPPAWAIRLFPFWPAAQPASFTGLLVKGGFTVSASWDSVAGAVVSPVRVTAAYVWGGGASAQAALYSPWGDGGAGSLSVACGGAPVAVSWVEGVAEWLAPAGAECLAVQATPVPPAPALLPAVALAQTPHLPPPAKLPPLDPTFVAPFYWCSFSLQGYSTLNLPGTTNVSIETLMVDGPVVDPSWQYIFNPSTPDCLSCGWASTVHPRARSRMYLLLDGGWESGTRPGSPPSPPTNNHCLNDTDWPQNAAAPCADRFLAVSAAAKAAGWLGLGVWYGARNVPGLIPGTNSNGTEQLLALSAGGVAIVKMDNVDRTPNILTPLARSLNLSLVLEHSFGTRGFNQGPSGTFPRALAKSFFEVANQTDVFRTYDAMSPLSVGITLARVAGIVVQLDAQPRGAGDPRAIFAMEDECVMASALLGICSVLRYPHHGLRSPDYDLSIPAHPGWGTESGGTTRAIKRKIDEVARSVLWAELAPPYGAGPLAVWGGGSSPPSLVDSATLTDSFFMCLGYCWDARVFNTTLEATAPARVTRGLPSLPTVTASGLPPLELANASLGPSLASTLPFVVASRHANGAIACATLGRTEEAAGWFFPLAHVVLRVDNAGNRTPPAFAFFGHYSSLELQFTEDFGAAGARIVARDLLGGAFVDITGSLNVSASGLSIVLPGKVIDSMGTAQATEGDASDPGMLLTIVH